MNSLLALESVDSTNDEARRLAADGAADGTVVWALRQTSGRGRRGREWLSPPGNLYCSILLRPQCSSCKAMQLTFVAAVAVAASVADALGSDEHVNCKWPNDVLIAGRKVAGILLESEINNDRLEWLVVGVGLNIVSHPQDSEFPATSLQAEGAAKNITPKAVLDSFGDHWQSSLKVWQNQGFAAIRDVWLKYAYGLGEEINLRLGKQLINGIFQTIDENGLLVLRHNGEDRRIGAGEIFIS